MKTDERITIRGEVAAFTKTQRETSRNPRIFAYSHYLALMNFDKAAGGDLPRADIKKIIEEFGLVGARGAPIAPSAFEAIWKDVKQSKAAERIARQDRSTAKDKWRRGFGDYRPAGPTTSTSARDHFLERTAGPRGPPSGEAASSVDVDAVIAALEREYRATLPAMPDPKPFIKPEVKT